MLMNYLKIKSSILVIITINIFAITTSHSSLTMDIDFTKTTAGIDCIRVSAFDTKRQALVHYETLPLVNFDRPLKSFLSNYVFSGQQDQEMNYQISLDQDGLVSIRAGGQIAQNPISHESYIITSVARIQPIGLGVSAYDEHLKKHFWVSRPIAPKTPMEMSALIKGMPNKCNKNPEFMLLRHDSRNPHSLSTLSSTGKGHFGEWITKITLFSYGYHFLPSIYSGNQGLDGIFLSFCHSYLFFSQSKLGNANNMALTVIENELDESKIRKRLNRMEQYGDEYVKLSRQIVLEFIKLWPHNMYKLAQCTFNCGLADLRIMPVDVLAFPRDGLTIYGASEEIKISAVKSTLQAFAPNSEEQFKLALQSVDLGGSPKKQSMRLLMTKLGIDELTQLRMLNELPNEDAEE